MEKNVVLMVVVSMISQYIQKIIVSLLYTFNSYSISVCEILIHYFLSSQSSLSIHQM